RLQCVNVRRGGQAIATHFVEKLRVRLRLQTFDVACTVTKKSQMALGTNAGIEQANGAGGDIAGVSVRSVAAAGLLFIEPHEIGVGHVDFAAHFELGRNIVTVKLQGNVANRSDVVCDVIADLTVAARRAQDKSTVFVEQRNSDAVDFQLHNPFDLL